MRLRFFAALVLIAAALLAAPAAAQSADGVPTPEAETDNGTAVGQLSPVVRVDSYEYHKSNETMTVELTAKVPRLITVRDALTDVDSEGFTSLPDARSVNLARGRNVIHVDVTPLSGDAAVRLSDPQANAAGIISTGAGGQLLHERNPAAAWIGGVGIGALSVIGGGWYGIRRLGGEPRRAER
jgi:hypothetical protein